MLMIVVYSPNIKDTIYALLKNLSNTCKRTDEGNVKSYIGMNVRKNPNGTITMSQPEHFILTKDDDGNGRKQEWFYRSVIGHEYISLSNIMRDLIQLIHIMLEGSSVFGMKFDVYNSYTTTFKVNKGAIELAKKRKHRS